MTEGKTTMNWSKVAKLLRDRYFWSAVGLIGITAIFLYAFQDYILSRLSSEMGYDTELLLLVLQNGLLLMAVVIATWRYKFRGGLVAVLAIGSILLPHLIIGMSNVFSPGHISVYALGTVTGIVLSWFISQRKQAEERTIHLTAVLKSIRNVNQLITREKDRQNLIQESCNLLVRRKGYEMAWILLLDEKRNSIAVASTGLRENAPTFLKQLEIGNYPVCVRELLAQAPPLIAYDRPGKQHEGCALADEHSSRDVFRCKLEYGGKLYGVMGVTIPLGVVFDNEEQALFLELCGDVAFALAKIEDDEKLRAVERRYQTVIQTSMDSFLITDAKGRFVAVNDAFCRLLGYSREDLLTMSLQDVEATETREETTRHIQRVVESGGDRFETIYRCRDERIVSLDVSVNYLSTEGLFFVFLRDVTEHKKVEEEIAKFKEVSDLANYGITMLDDRHIITYVNKACAQIHGYDPNELMGKNCTILVPTGQVEIVDRLFERSTRTGGFTNEEVPHRRKDGTIFPALMTGVTVKDGNGKPLYTAITVIDITERRKMQQQLMAQDRLASIGQLTAGVTHEINNPLTSVIGFSDLLLQRKDLPDDIKADLTIVNDEAKRTAKIVKNLLIFARRQPEGKVPVDINEQIQRVLELRGHEQIVNNIVVTPHLASDLPQVLGNASQLQQVFFNIVINAEFFMLEAHQKGNLTITTELIGDIVRVSFTDDGPGISEESMKNIFTPFFTTKDVGKGTGLGLSICHGIIAEHDGKIYAESRPGEGATFIVELPIDNKNIKEQANG